ncbi:MAG: FkbM family methyltransferase [Actinomycetota bacterium]|nr:FkbM family methyltransferase [Actinomycetota bacterium]
MERLIQRMLQRVLGFDRYLFWFSRFKIATLRWDRKEGAVLHFIEHLPRHGVVLDIGANIGIMTVLLARHTTGGVVHAFEPIPDNFRALTRIVSHYRLTNVVLHQMALGDEAGELRMVMPEEDHVRMQGLSHAVGVGAADDGTLYTVPQVRLDDFEALADAEVVGIKIDVENFEQFVFRGGRALLERCRPPVYTELGSDENRDVCFELFGELGYSVGVLDGQRVVDYDPARHDVHNYFMTPPTS